MSRIAVPYVMSSALAILVAGPVWAGNREWKIIEASAGVVHALSEIPLKGIPQALLHDAAGVAILPRVVKVGLIADARSGSGVLVVHQPDGYWSNPIFIILKGHGVGAVAGIETTELVLVFKTRKSLDHALEGKLTLGGDVSVAAGPLGRESEVGKDGWVHAEVYSYSRSHGLFAGVSLEGAHIHIDTRANEAFYGCRGGLPNDVLVYPGIPAPPVAALKGELAHLAGAPIVAQPPVIIPAPVIAPAPAIAPAPVVAPLPPAPRPY